MAVTSSCAEPKTRTGSNGSFSDGITRFGERPGSTSIIAAIGSVGAHVTAARIAIAARLPSERDRVAFGDDALSTSNENGAAAYSQMSSPRCRCTAPAG